MTTNVETIASAKERRHLRLVTQAEKAFSGHVITKQSEGRWLLQRRYEDGVPDWTMAAEIISLAGGALYVGGDIDHVIFAWYSDCASHTAKVRWMGRCDDIGYYVAQKARIGMTGTECIELYDRDVACEEIQDWLDDELAGTSTDETRAFLIEDVLRGMRDGVLPWETREGLIDYLIDMLGSDFMEERYSLGLVLAPRVYYAHAALRRLCDLLAAETTQPQPRPGATSP